MSLVTWFRAFKSGFVVGRADFVRSNVNLVVWLGGYGLRVVTQGIFFALLGKLVDSPDQLYFLLVGQILVVGAVNASWAMYSSSWDRLDGIYPLLVVAPVSLLPAQMGRSFVWVLSGIGSSLLALVILVPLFGISLPWPQVAYVPALLTLTCLGSYFTALFIGVLLSLIPRAGTLFINVISTTFIAFCGVSVPVDYWPAWLQMVSNLVPLTHGLEATRIVLVDGATADALVQLCYLALLSVLWLALTVIMVDRIASRGRHSGTIGFTTL